MAVIKNKWIEKEKKKKVTETAPAFESNPGDTWLPVDIKKTVVRHITASKSIMSRTLRGVRK